VLKEPGVSAGLAVSVAALVRKAPREVVLRFRHPTKGTMKGVTINGKDWKQFDAGK